MNYFAPWSSSWMIADDELLEYAEVCGQLLRDPSIKLTGRAGRGDRLLT